MRTCLMLIIVIVFSSMFATYAQDDPPQELLYRCGTSLCLVNAETGEVTPLPDIETSDQDSWRWSPNGRYLVAILRDEENFSLRLYDVEQGEWLPDPSIVSDSRIPFGWSSDNQFLSYAITQTTENPSGQIAQLWVYDLSTQGQNLLRQIPPEGEVRDWGIETQWWSPTGEHIAYIEYDWIMGGSINNIMIISLATNEVVRVTGDYYGSYWPIWSPDGEWIALIIQEHYFTNRIPMDGEVGDVYLFSIVDNALYRITATPTINEYNLLWSPDSLQIMYDVSTLQTTIVAVESITAIDESLSNTPRFDVPFMDISSALTSPNGEYLAVNEFRGNDEGYLYITDVSGRIIHDIGALREGDYLIGWRPTTP